MNFQLKTKEELIDELQKLQRSYDSLKISFDTVVKDRERTETIEQFSLANFRNLADTIHDGILIAPANGQHIYANRQTCELLGYSPEEILQTTQKDLADPETYPLLRQRLQDRIAGHPVPDIYETALRRKDGTTFFADVNGTKIQWYGQDCYMVLFRDATDRKNTEKLLRDSEKKWRELVQTLPDYIALYDCDGKYLFLNHFAEGFSIKDIEGKTYSDFLPDDSKLMYDRAFEVAKLTNSTQYFEYIAFGDNKSLRNYESYFVPICENGEFANMMVIARDITDRKQVARNLQDSEQKYRNLVENSLVGVLKSKVNGDIIYVNDAIVSMLEFDSREELIAAGAFMRYKYPSQREEFVKILKRDGLVREFEANILTKRGNERVFLYSLVLSGDTIDGTLIDITDRKQIERKVIENQQFLKTITSEVLEVIFALNAQGIFTFSEGKGLAKLGLQPGQVVGISVFDFYRDFPEVISTLKEALNGRVVKTEGLEVGNLKYDTTYQPIFDESGQVTSIVGLAIDVTEAKKAEKALREAHETLEKRVWERTAELAKSKKLLDETGRLAKVGGWEVDLLTGINYWSEVTRMIHEVEADFDPNLEIFINFYAPEYVPLITGLIERLINHGEPFDTELEIISAKQNRFWVRALGQPFFENGKIARIGGVIQDITGRKVAENELSMYREHLEDLIIDRTSELETQYALLDAIINSPVDIIIFSLDKEYRYTAFNENHRKEMLKIWNAGIQIGSSILDYMTPEMGSLAKISIDRVLNGEFFTEIQHQPGANVYYEFNWNPILLGKDIAGATVYIQDITERQKSKNEIQLKNEQLIKLNAEKDKFFSIIAHDLKTPFNGILGFSQMMIEHLKEKNFEQVGKYAEIILKSSNRAMDLLLNLMEWAQTHVGRMEFNPEYFKIIDLIEDVEALFDNIARQKSITIAISSPLHSSINADKAMISTVLRNLISNAIKFTKPGGKIIISVVENPGETMVGVSDNGIGISPLNLQRLFRIDENYSTAGTQNEKGTGLGLILCKEFIEKHGGKIWVESTENTGSSFFFTLPVHQVKSNSNTVNDSDYDPGGGVRSEGANKGLKVLIADDDEISGFLLSKLVQTSCKEILIAKDGLEAVDHHRANSDIDLILMDIKMPKMDGFEATRQIRKSDNKVIIFAQTSFSSSSDRDSSIEAGCNEHISKPVKKELLMELINKYLG